jgi:hypothetical protein
MMSLQGRKRHNQPLILVFFQCKAFLRCKGFEERIAARVTRGEKKSKCTQMIFVKTESLRPRRFAFALLLVQ